MSLGNILSIVTDGTYLYVTDDRQQIAQVNMSGAIVKMISTPESVLWMTHDSVNNIIYAFDTSLALVSFTSSSTSVALLNQYSSNDSYTNGNAATATIDYVIGMAVDGANGFLYISSLANTVRVINLNAGGTQYSIANYVGTKGTAGFTSLLLMQPQELVYNNGILYINDANASFEPVIRSVANGSGAISNYGFPAAASPPIASINGMAFVNGKLYFSDRLSIYTFDGDVFVKIAGTGIDGSTNGNGTAASFDTILQLTATSSKLFAFENIATTDVRQVVLTAPYAVTTFLTGVNNATGGGDPYVTTFSNISYKLPALDAPIRYFQTMEDGKLLTINAQLKTVERSDMEDDTLRSLIVLRKKMTTKQYINIIHKLMKPETLCFFERISIQHGDQRLVVNLWNSKFEVVENTLRCAAEKVERPDLLKKAGGIYNGYKADTIKLRIGTTAVYLSVYDSPMIRNGISVESHTLKGANGVIVNALSPGAMTLRSLASVEPVSTRNSLKAVTKVETFVDHDGVRSKNIVSYK